MEREVVGMVALTEESKNMPSEFTDTIDICCHQCHNLGFTRELVIFLVLFICFYSVCCSRGGIRSITFGSGGCRSRGRSDVFPDQCFCE